VSFDKNLFNFSQFIVNELRQIEFLGEANVVGIQFSETFDFCDSFHCLYFGGDNVVFFIFIGDWLWLIGLDGYDEILAGLELLELFLVRKDAKWFRPVKLLVPLWSHFWLIYYILNIINFAACFTH